MEEEREINNQDFGEEPKMRPDYFLGVSALVSAIILAAALVYATERRATNPTTVDRLTSLGVAGLPSGLSGAGTSTGNVQESAPGEKALSSDGVLIPVSWGDLGARLVSAGVIDAERFRALYEGRGAFTDEYRKLLLGHNEGKLTITKDNAGYLLNLFWALGLANKNPILDSGEMQDLRYGGAQNFASTAGWTMAKGNPMDHYSRHIFFTLTPAEQTLVDAVSKGIYRPCCDNSTHFPDCNHGMAMLGLLELMASQGASEEQLYAAALAVNAYWFPDNYAAIAQYFEGKGMRWDTLAPKDIVGPDYSSAQGYQRVRAQTVSAPSESPAGCGVDAGEPAAPQRSSVGCGI